MSYVATRSSVEQYFDRTATKTWERLTSDAPVSGIRATVRAGRDRMRALMLCELPADLSGKHVLDAGCGTGAIACELARRGAQVTAVDISPSLIDIARKRMPRHLSDRISWRAGDMCGGDDSYDHILAMDSLIYYSAADIADVLGRMAPRLRGRFVFTVAPRTPLLMAMWRLGRLFPRSDRAPTMVPHTAIALERALASGRIATVGRVKSGFYISQAMVFRGDAA